MPSKPLSVWKSCTIRPPRKQAALPGVSPREWRPDPRYPTRRWPTCVLGPREDRRPHPAVRYHLHRRSTIQTVIDGCHGRCDFRITFRDGRSFSGYAQRDRRLAGSDSHQGIPAAAHEIWQPAFDVTFPGAETMNLAVPITRRKGPNRAIIAGPTKRPTFQ